MYCIFIFIIQVVVNVHFLDIVPSLKEKLSLLLLIVIIKVTNKVEHILSHFYVLFYARLVVADQPQNVNLTF